MKRYKRTLSALLAGVMLFSVMPIERAAAATTHEMTGTVINVQDYGADPTGAKDSTKAVEQAIEAAKKLPANEAKTILFPTGEYHFYEETAPERELYVSNTVGIKPEHKMKRIGILLENMQNVTVDGGDSMFMYHGDITAFAAIGCTNVIFRNFDIDHASPSVVDLTIESVIENENAVTVYVPDCYTYEIRNGNEIHWMGEKGIVSGKPYWEGDNALQYCQIYDAKSGRCWRQRNHVPSDSLFNNVKSIEDMGNGRLKFTYQSGRRELPVAGYSYEIRNTTRTTPGVFLWRSENVTLQNIDVHFLHGFGMVGQLSKNITLDTVKFRVRPESGRTTAGFADFVQMSSVGGKVTIKNCDFSVAHDDPINIHGTFLSVEDVSADGRTLTLKYNHHETAGFPQYYEGDQVDFATHSTMVPVKDSLRTVEKVIDDGWGKDTIKIRLDREVPQLSQGGQYVIENVTYIPEVEITGCNFANIPTRGILVTTRKKVVIENNHFDAMNMASIFISCDAQDWYESGHTADVTIRNNVFDRPGSESILVGPTGSNDPNHQLHSNMTIENNIFNLEKSVQVVNAKSVKDLVIRNNVANRYNSDVELAISTNKSELRAGETLSLSTEITGGDKMSSQLYRFENCKNVTVADNTYDAGLNQKIEVTAGTTKDDVTVVNDNLKIGQDNNTDPKGQLYYFSSNPNVLTVSSTGEINAVAAGTAEVHAFSACGARVYESNVLKFTVTGETVPTGNVKVTSDKTLLNVGDTQQIVADSEVSWSVKGDAVEIDRAGVVTAKKSGVAEVVATAADGRVGSILIAVQLSEGVKSNEWTVDRDANNWTIDPKADSLTIHAKPGGDWAGGNRASSIFLTAPQDTNDFTATVKLHNRTKDGYEEAGLIAFVDDDNYVAIERKHADGSPNFAVSKEKNGSPSEKTAVYQFADDTAWFRIEKKQDTLTCQVSEDGQNQWKTVDTVTGYDLANCRVGIIACNSEQNTPFTFSDFMLDGKKVPFALPVVVPTASDAKITLDANSAKIEHKFEVSDGTAEGNSAYRWYLSCDGTVRPINGANGKTIQLKPEYSNCQLQAAIVPIDKNGRVGEPIMTAPIKVPGVAVDPQDTSLATVNLGATPIFDPATKTYKLTLPMSIDRLPVIIKPSNPDAVVSVTMDGSTITDSIALTQDNHKLMVNVAAGNASETYTIEINRRKNSLAALKMLTLGDLKFDPDVHFYQLVIGENQKNAALSLEAAAGSVKVTLNNKVLVENTRSVSGLGLSCADGLNTLEIKVIAEDGISTATYRVAIIGSLASQSGGGGSDTKPIKPEPPKPEKPDIDIIPVVPGNPEMVKPFTDVKEHWAQDAIAWAVTNKLFTGVSTSQFAPDNAMNRGMLVTVLHRLAGEPNAGEQHFSDVPAGVYYEDAVAWASQFGVVTGMGNGKFAPNDNVTREQLAVILYRFAGSPAVSNMSVSFTDSTAISSWAQNAMAWAVNEGLLSGMANGSLAPQGQATRAQVATILMRFTGTLD